METLRLLKENLVLVELFSGMVGLFQWQQFSKRIDKRFALYLLVVAFLEILGQHLPRGTRTYYYTLGTIPFQFCFILLLFYHFSDKYKQVAIVGGVVYLISFLTEFSESTANNIFLSISYTVGNIVLLVLILLYFYDLVFSEKLFVFYQESMFWIVLGLSLFYIGTLPYYGLYNYLKVNHYDFLLNYTWVVIILDYLMYISFAVSFTWSKKR